MEKKDIRRMVKERRMALAEEDRIALSRKICGDVCEMPEFLSAEEVFVYMDCKGEVSTRLLIEEAWRLRKRVAAPKVMAEDMVFYYISSYKDVADGYFHVPEPVTFVPASDEKALLIVPGVGFDSTRNRCGYGQGFYDRYLTAHPWHVTVGLAFDFQIVDAIAVRDEDVRPMKVVTQSRIFSE